MQIAENEKWQKGDWEYTWNANGSLRSVKLPNGDLVQYEYDALGRRTKKLANGKIKRYLWDGNVLLHEWEYNVEEQPRKIINKLGEISFNKPEPVQNLITWIYEQGSFVPCAKIINNEVFSIINDYLGTPIQAYNQQGELIWERELDIYGQTRKEKGISNFVPFRYQGQYYDEETNLCYNRFRYYDPNSGTYISKDPIGLLGGFALYGYVKDVNSFVDIFGLFSCIFPVSPDDMTKILGVEPKIGVTPDGTPRYTWEPNSNTRIRFESHPEGLKAGDVGFNPRHHGEHYHIETKPDNMSWSKAKKTKSITKSKPIGYTKGSGTGFLPGEIFPGVSIDELKKDICK